MINRINPLYVIALFLIIILFMLFKLQTLHHQIVDATNEYQTDFKVAKELKLYKNIYKDKRDVISKLNRILNNKILKNLKINRRITSSKFIIDIDSLKKKELDYLMKKIINQFFIITFLNIKKKDNNYASLKVKITW